MSIACCCGGGVGPDGPTEPITCFCASWPVTFTMASCSTTCNFSMFQNCTIMWVATPSFMTALGITDSHVWISTTTFSDPTAGGSDFYYYVSCSFNQVALTRIYPTGISGSHTDPPFRDGILYSWNIFSTGPNTCSPFNMNTGAPFAGSDASCCVTLYGSGSSPPACVVTGLGTIC